MTKQNDALEALSRIESNASYGISSGDYEIMNRQGYEKKCHSII